MVDREAPRVAQPVAPDLVARRAVAPTNGLSDGDRVRVRRSPRAGRSAGACRGGCRGPARCAAVGRRRRPRCRACRRDRTGAGPRCGCSPNGGQRQHRSRLRGIGDVRIGRSSTLNSSTWMSPERAARIDAVAGVEDVEEPVGRVVRVEGHREQPALAVGVVRALMSRNWVERRAVRRPPGSCRPARPRTAAGRPGGEVTIDRAAEAPPSGWSATPRRPAPEAPAAPAGSCEDRRRRAACSLPALIESPIGCPTAAA